MVERLRMWLAARLYQWACWLARQDLARPFDPAAAGEFGRIQALRAERAAREWHERYQELRKQRVMAHARRRVDF